MRHGQIGLIAIGIALAVFASPASATRNVGSNLGYHPSANVITQSSPYGVGRILYAPSEADDPGYRAAIAGLSGGVVDYFDARFGTPDAALLDTYDCVYTWANYAYADEVLFGDNLADYVDRGGKVVLGVFCTYTVGNNLAGRIMTVGYSPVVSPNGTNHFTYDHYVGDGSTCIHQGVTAYECGARDELVTQGGGLVDGHYSDGEIGHAYRPDDHVIYSNGSGDQAIVGTVGASGDWARLVANACGCDGTVPVKMETWGRAKATYR